LYSAIRGHADQIANCDRTWARGFLELALGETKSSEIDRLERNCNRLQLRSGPPTVSILVASSESRHFASECVGVCFRVEGPPPLWRRSPETAHFRCWWKQTGASGAVGRE
jgi:hypothetical protein